MINLLKNIVCSSLGKKYIMAISGLALFGFVVGHCIGNLQIFLPNGREAINRYGAFLQGLGELLWVERLAMLTLVVLHFWSAITLTLENRAARPVAYTTWQPTAASYASRTMIYGGLVVAAFIVYHILHYTVLANVGGVNLGDLSKYEYEYQGRHIHDIFKMLVVGFSNPLVALFYIISVGLLCFHLSHGIEAMVQSLGLRFASYNAAVRCFAAAISVFLFVGYSSIPIAILLGYGKEIAKEVVK